MSWIEAAILTTVCYIEARCWWIYVLRRPWHLP